MLFARIVNTTKTHYDGGGGWETPPSFLTPSHPGLRLESLCHPEIRFFPGTRRLVRRPLVFLFRFDGRVVAKLPFTPLSYIQGLSHRNLLGDDTTDCSFIFLYILCTMSIRQVSGHARCECGQPGAPRDARAPPEHARP